MSKVLTQEEIIAKAVAEALAKQEEKTALRLQEQERQFELKQKQKLENKISLGCTVVEKSIIQGKPIIDKDTKQQKEVNGEPAFYPDKYTAKLSFRGGEIETPINKDNFDLLDIGLDYLALGRLGEVKEFGASVIKPIFTQFIKI